MPNFSNEELKRFEKEDYLLLDMQLEDAKKAGKKEFKVNVQAFDQVPNYQQHISSWASCNNVSYSQSFNEFIFHIL